MYNFDNREKVRKDEEEAAKEEQLKREQARKRDSEVRLLQLRRSRGLDLAVGSGAPAVPPESKPDSGESPKSEADSKHINLFDGIKIFDPIVIEKKRDDEGDKRKKMKKEERVVGPEDEKYRLGYGVAGKGVKSPWYMMRPGLEVEEEQEEEKVEVKSGGKKKTVEELREERLKREKAEKERERALLMENGRSVRGSSGGRDRYRDRYYRRDR